MWILFSANLRRLHASLASSYIGIRKKEILALTLFALEASLSCFRLRTSVFTIDKEIQYKFDFKVFIRVAKVIHASLSIMQLKHYSFFLYVTIIDTGTLTVPGSVWAIPEAVHVPGCQYHLRTAAAAAAARPARYSSSSIKPPERDYRSSKGNAERKKEKSLQEVTLIPRSGYLSGFFYSGRLRKFLGWITFCFSKKANYYSELVELLQMYHNNYRADYFPCPMNIPRCYGSEG